MNLELSCLNISYSLPSNNNLTDIPIHSYYNPNGKFISELISSSLSKLTFSTNDIHSFLKQITSNNMKTLDVSTIVNMKPVTSTIIYLSITLALFIALSLIFCIVSCTNCCKRKTISKSNRIKKRKCSGRCICILLILLICLIVIGEMIYIVYKVNKTKIFLNDSIKQINNEIYPKDILIYLNKLIEQFKQVDQYTTQNDSILIGASHSIFVKAFDEIFRENYFFDEIRNSSINSQIHINQLNEMINKITYSLPNETINIFKNIQDDNNNMFNYLQIPLEELCNYANGNDQDKDIDQTILNALNQIHQQLIKLIDTIQKDFINKISIENNPTLINKNLENQILSYIHIAGIILPILIVFIGIIPIILFIIIFIYRLCHSKQNIISSNYRMKKKDKRESESSIEEKESIVSSIKSSNGYSNKVICCMRILFIPIIIIGIIIIILTGILYGVNLLIGGLCQTVHYDKPFIVSFLIDDLIGINSSDLIIDGSDLKTTVLTMIDDCSNQIHFTQHFLENHFNNLNNNTDQAINQLNQKIFIKFNNSIDNINIQFTIDNLNSLSNSILIYNLTDIDNQIQLIINDLKTIEIQFNKITNSVPTLPNNLVNETINEFETYLNDVLELTIDKCPLPLSTIYKGDTLVCHHFATSINGLWLSLFIYMFFIMFGLCICGLCLYKRSQSLSTNHSIFDMDQRQNFRF